MPAGTGSRVGRQYRSDDGGLYAVNIDKSNADDLSFEVLSDSSLQPAVMSGKPRPGVVMRQVSCFRLNSNGETVRRKFPIPTEGDWALLLQSPSPTITVSGNLYFVTAFIGEKQYRTPIIDTEITDTVPASP